MEFGASLRQLRVARDLTQEALAELVGCAAQTLRSFEIGRRRPSLEMAARIADVLGVPTDERAAFVRLARAPLDAARAADAVSASAITPPEPAFDPKLAPRTQPGAVTPPHEGLIGRHDDQKQLREALLDQRQRLVTLLGPGGAGKTRLALQASADAAPFFADGTVVVPLAATHDADSVIAALGAAVGCPLAGVADAQAALVAFLRPRTLLLVLDNLEHLLGENHADAITSLLVALLREAPGVTLLVTSRERLRLQAEWVLELGGLALPADDLPQSIAHADAVLLFVARARRVSSGFALNDANRHAVAQICRRLDGLPLALELAAAQVAFLSLATLHQRLDQALPLLGGGARDLPQRQRTMRATIDWSYALLSPDERRLFARLGVLLSSWTVEAAETVGVGSAAPVLGLLRQLIDRSLVVRDDAGGDVRYRMLEPVRQYAVELLNGQPAEVADARRRHAAFFATLAEKAYPLLRGPEQVQWVALLEGEYPNLHAAMTWLLTEGEDETAAHFAYALWLFLWVRGHFRDGQQWAARLLERLPPEPSLARAHAVLVACVLAYGQAEYAPAALLAAQCLELYRAVGFHEGVAYGLAMVGLSAAGMGQNERATQYMAEAVALNIQLGTLGNKWSAAMTLTYWAPIPLAQGDYAEAARLAGRALALAREIGDRIGTYSALYTLALVGQAAGEGATAHQRFGEALRLAVELGDVGNIVACLSGIASLAAAHRAPVEAVRLWGAAAATRETREAARYTYTIDDAVVEEALATLRTQLSPAAFDTVWAAGRAMTLEEAVAAALAVQLIET